MPTATVTSKGQVTIPKKIRDKLKLRSGDRLDFTEENQGRIIIRKASISVEELEGILHRPGGKAVSVQAMHKAIRRRYGSQQ